MINEELINNCEKSLNQKYNAVCFDIDGTLTKNNSKKIDDRVLPMLANILKKHITVVFITGRGETGLNDLSKEIVDDLKNKYGVTDRQLQRMYALTNDGARIFMTSRNSSQIFNVSEYISSLEDLTCLRKLNEKIKKMLETTSLKNCCKISYSKDLSNDIIINIRLLILIDDEQIANKIINMIDSLIANTKNSNLNLTMGINEGK